MHLRHLKPLRVAVAALFFLVLTLAFLGAHLPHPLVSLFASVQFIPAFIALVTGTSLALGAIIVLVVTLAAGRIYCSAICPLGILQDVISRIASLFRRKPFFLRYAPAWTKVRHLFFWIVFLSFPFGSISLVLAWLDPYSIFGRTVSLLVRPLVLLANNAILPLAEKAHVPGIYHVDVSHAATPLLLGVGAVLLLIVVMASLRGRLYCNTVCPVGTLLGFIASRSFLKLKISADACGKCAECLKSCKAQCIDLKAGTVDASRCVACYNCLSACDQGAMRLETNWSFSNAAKPAPSSTQPPDSGRRQFLLTATGGALVAGASLLPDISRADDDGKKHGEGHGKNRKYKNVITPPIAGDTDLFLSHCTACQLCISSCTTGVLQPAFLQYGPQHLLKPRMDYSKAFCNYTCHRCTEVCPTGAIPFLPVPQKQITRIGMAHFTKENCIVSVYHTDCGACSEHCPTKAVHMVPYENGLVIPEVDKSLCIGCGACEFACPADDKAILVHGAPKNKLARRPSENKPDESKVKKDGFPF